MKYTVELMLDIPIETAGELMDNWDNMYKWMEGLQSHKHVSGTPGEPGAKTEMVFKTKKREMTLVEEIEKRDFPNQFIAIYHSPMGWNRTEHTWKVVSENQTKWTQVSEFKMKGIVKILAFLMPGAFKKQSLKHMNDFKRFAEAEAKNMVGS